MSEKRKIKLEEEVNPDLEIYEVLVLDRSGSMSGVKSTVIEQVNNSIKGAQEAAKKDGIKTYYSLILFDSELESLYNFSPITEISLLTESTYRPTGGTALNDAIARAIEELKLKLKGKEKDPNVNVTIRIFTDGWENSSKVYPGKGNKELFTYIGEIKDAYGWTFSFVGAGSPEEIAQTAESYNIPKGATLSYSLTGDQAHDGEAVCSSFNMMADASTRSRTALARGIKLDPQSYFSSAAEVANVNSSVAAAYPKQ